MKFESVLGTVVLLLHARGGGVRNHFHGTLGDKTRRWAAVVQSKARTGCLGAPSCSTRPCGTLCVLSKGRDSS